MTKLPPFVLPAILVFNSPAWAQSFTASPSHVVVIPQGKVRLALSGTSASDVTVTTAPDSSVAEFDAATATLTGKGPGSTTLKLRKAGDEADLAISIDVRALTDVLVVGADRPLVQGESRDLSLQPVDTAGQPVPGLTVELQSTNTALLATAGTALKAQVSADQGSQTVPVKVFINGLSVKTFQVTILEPIRTVAVSSPVVIQEGESIDLPAQLIGTSGSIFKPADRNIQVDPNRFVEVIEGGKLRAKELPNLTSAESGPATVVFRSKEGSGATDVTATAVVNIKLRPGYITFEPPTDVLPVGGVKSFRARIKDRFGNDAPNAPITWTLKPEQKDFVALAPSIDSATVLWRSTTEQRESERPDLIEITATSPVAGTNVSGTLFVRMPGRVVDFSPLRVSLSIMDEQLATDLYGKKTAHEFHVARVRLNNNLKNDPSGQSTGASILAFSDSIEVYVGLDKRRIDGKKNTPWEEVTRDDMRRFGLADPTGDHRLSADRGADPPPTCKGFVSYRPYTFEMIVNTVDRRDERSGRGKTFRALNILGSAASFITAVAVPGAGSDLPLALEKYSNLFIPGMEKIFPSLRESHRQNIVSQIMKPIEEIPFGSDLSRVLFFPKTSFRGLIRDHEVRISEICPYTFQIEVAVIKKGGKTTVQGATPE